MNARRNFAAERVVKKNKTTIWQYACINTCIKM